MKFAEFIAMNYSSFDKALRKNFTTERVKQIYAISDEFASKLSNQGEDSELTVRQVSDEEISEKSVDAYECNTMDEAFEMGAEWMRDKMNSLKS